MAKKIKKIFDKVSISISMMGVMDDLHLPKDEYTA